MQHCRQVGTPGADHESNSFLVAADIQAPPLVKVGDEFIITATMDNHAAGTQKLVSLDFGDAYLDGIAITAFE